jgi:autotransporter-associated beta strand protein
MLRKYYFTQGFLILAITALIAIPHTQAATVTWDGSENGSWDNDLNWSAPPAVTGDILIFSGTANQANTNDAGVTSIATLTLSTGGWDINLGGSVEVATLNATDSSSIMGNVGINNDNRTFTLNGTSSTLSIESFTFKRTSSQTLTVNGSGNALEIGSLNLNPNHGAYTRTIRGSADVTVNGPVTSLNVTSLKKELDNTLTLNGTCAYSGNTTITGGTLALGGSGSINDSARISIAAGATFDVSAQSAYTLSTNLTASGTATPATIKGAASGTVSMGAQAITLTWSGASSGVDSIHPPLTIAQAALTLNNNTITVNVPGTALGEGVYTLISAPAGITGTINTAPSYSGNGQDPSLPENVRTDLSIIGNSVILTIAVPAGGTIFLFE